MRKFLFIALLCAAAQMMWADIVVTTDEEIREAVQIDNATIQLGADIDLSNSTLSIGEGLRVVIDLNGHKLDRKLTERGKGGGQVITVRKGATLSLSRGTLAGGWGGNGGGLSNEGGTVTLYHVTITGCTGDDKGGGICNLGGTLTMTGGALTDNTCIDKDDPTGGAGIFNAEGATATLKEVTISGNKETVYGGAGICNYGEITLDGCTITGNKAITTGGGIWNKGALNIKGALTIQDNVNSKGQTNNLYISGDTLINVIGSLEGSQIGIAHDRPKKLTRGYNQYNFTPASNYFLPDAASLVIRMTDGEAELVTPEDGTIYYNERSWNSSQRRVETEVKSLSANEYNLLTSIPQGDLKPEQITHWKSGYYVCQGDITLGNVEIDEGQTVHLILCNGSHLNIDKAYAIGELQLRNNASLFIYDQPNLGNAGLLTPNSILGSDDHKKDTEARIIRVIIHGGKITAEAQNLQPGIGQHYGHESSRYVIYDGIIKVSGDQGCPGIGSTGQSNGNAGIIEIYGGTIEASSSRTDPGWGQYYSAAAIGGGGKCSGATIYIHGGEITANGGHEAAGIGCGQEADSGKDFYVSISGGTVKAYGHDYGAGIGGGDGVRGGTVKISGGHVEAYGGVDAAGIGGGEGGKGGTVEITGGYVYAKGNDNGAGIGGGEDADGGNVTITGGTVIAKTTGEDEGSRAIGPGDGSDNYGSLDLGDDVMVSSERKAKAAERKSMCWYRTNVTIEPCDHSGEITYTVDGITATDHHISHCEYCLHSETELHNFKDGKCTVCGAETTLNTVTLWMPTSTTYYVPASSVQVVPNTNYVLPLASLRVPHYKFIGWEADDSLEGISGYMWDITHVKTDMLYRTGDKYKVTGNIAFVPRYRLMDITLKDNASNGKTLADNDGETVHTVTISGRALRKDNTWQTLALPFGLNAEKLAASPLAGSELMQLDLDGEYEGNKTGYDAASNTLYLYFSDATEIEAGKPYVVRWESGKDTINPVFTNVTLTNQTADVYAPGFGLYSMYGPNTYTEAREDIVYLGANNTFLQPDGSEITIGAFRAYVKLGKFYMLQAAANPLTIVTNLADAVVPTEIERVSGLTDEWMSGKKIIRDGLLLIEREGKTYNVNGIEVK